MEDATSAQQRRAVTSAVPGMSVSDMRRCLAEVRALLTQQSTQEPFDMSARLSNGMRVWEFVHQVSVGLHKKRTSNRKRSGSTNGADDELMPEGEA